MKIFLHGNIKNFFDFYFFELTDYNQEIKEMNSNNCGVDNFYETFELQNYNSSNINTTNQSLNKFTCYFRNNSRTEENNMFDGMKLVNFNLKIRIDSFDEAIDFLRNGSIYIQIIYPSYFLDIQSMKNPFTKFLKSSVISLTPYFRKEFKLYFSFFKLYDDISQLSSMDYKLYTHPNIENETGFFYSLDEKNGDFSFYPNRTIKDIELLALTFDISDKYRSI
jgi:hypothetical protein